MTVAIVGLGRMGRAVAAALAQRGIALVACDDRPTDAHAELAERHGFRFVGAPDRGQLEELVGGSDEVLPTPGLAETHPVFDVAARAGVPVISEFDLAARWDERPVVAITGTNGKTTVTMMVTAMLDASGRRAAAVGNTDIPLVEALDDPATEVFVVEASSFRLAASQRFRPSVATWLNFTPDHLDVHRSLGHYEAAKARIWADQTSGDTAIGNLDDPVVSRHLASCAAARLGYSIDATAAADGLASPALALAGCYRLDGERLVADDGTTIVRSGELTRALPHDVSNALAAAATARAAGASWDGVRSVLRSWTVPAHRVSLVAEAGGIRYYDDSKATTPHAVLAALAGFPSAVLIAGGQNKGLDLSVLAEAADRVRAVVAIGACAHEVVTVFEGRCPVIEAASMDEAVRAARAAARPGDAVLLSPGTASFDWYANYGERGDDFARAVRALIGAGEAG